MNITPSENTITVVGLGYVGLPTALAFHEAGFLVNGVDISDSVLSKIKSGEMPFSDDSLEITIPVDSVRWNATGDFQTTIPNSDFVLITVPTPVTGDNEPDLSHVISASRSVLENLDRNSHTILTIESTVYPGVTRKVIHDICTELSIPIDEIATVAYSPERVSPGDPKRTVDRVARIVGCDDPEMGRLLQRSTRSRPLRIVHMSAKLRLQKPQS